MLAVCGCDILVWRWGMFVGGEGVWDVGRGVDMLVGRGYTCCFGVANIVLRIGLDMYISLVK